MATREQGPTKRLVNLRPDALVEAQREFFVTHPTLFALVEHQAAGLPEHVRARIFQGATIGYALVGAVLRQTETALPVEGAFTYEKERDTQIAARLRDIVANPVEATGAPNPAQDVTVLGEIRNRLPDFYETGMALTGRLLRQPQSAFRPLIDEGPDSFLDLSDQQWVVDTTIPDTAAAVLCGYSEVVVRLYDLAEARQLEIYDL